MKFVLVRVISVKNDMRVISGSAKGRKLKTLRGADIRPTQDKVRGAIFNMLGGAVIGASVLDLFSGTGALGIEALSRGAQGAVFVDNDMRCIKIIKDNLKNCGFNAIVVRGDVYRIINKLDKHCFNIVFADPPYEKDLAKRLLSRLYKSSIIKDFCFVIIEHSKRDIVEKPSPCRKIQEKKYGDTVVSFYRYEKHNRDLPGHI